MSKKPIDPNAIPASREQVLNALMRSGYLLEHRVEQFFSEKGFHISNSNYFVDDLTDKMREIDLIAENSDVSLQSPSNDVVGTFTYRFICECENNPQPVVFFLSDSKGLDHLGQGLFDLGVPNPILPNDASLEERRTWGDTFFNSANVYGEHHFFQMQMTSQYCTFVPKDKNRPEGDWIAKHLDEQHDTLTNLLKGAAYVIERDDEHVSRAPIFYYGKYQIYLSYPVLILKDYLYTAKVTKDGLELQECDHLVYWMNHQIEDSEHLFGIDVIKESYLPKYLKLIQDEVEKMHAAILKNPYLKSAIEKWTNFQIEGKEADSQEIPGQ